MLRLPNFCEENSLSVIIVQFQKRNLQTKFAASKRGKILKSISIVFDNCSYVKLQVSKLNDLGKLAPNQQVYIFTPKLANTLTRHCFGLVIDAKLSSITKKPISCTFWLQALSFASLFLQFPLLLL